MDARLNMVIGLVIFLSSLMLIVQADRHFNRTHFPKGFVFGTAASAYQYEGAYNKDGRGPSIWDTYTHQHPERILDRSNGNVANDQYNLYKRDVVSMKDIGMDAYRFSISWSRVLPKGKISGGVNKKGIKYYNNLIDELKMKGLQPYVTLFHWDMPQQLEDEYGGFLNKSIVLDFQNYAELCYKKFGDRVKKWITLNEPYSFSFAGYDLGIFAPGRCSKTVGNCTIGNSGTEPYIVAHNQLLAHAAAVKVYKEKYQVVQRGDIGITLVSHWMVPFSKKKVDKDAAQRAIDFMFGWFMDPLQYGYYPKSMQFLVGNRLPKFTKHESSMVKGSYDFIGLNYYTSYYARDVPFSRDLLGSYSTNSNTRLTSEKNGTLIGIQAGSWIHMYPKGLGDLLLYIKERYTNPTIYITENGVDQFSNGTVNFKEAQNDNIRIVYHYLHLKVLHKAISKGVDLRGYFAWSFLDNFEWASGYNSRFGINFVDFQTLKRYPKKSSFWFKNFLIH